MEEIFDSGRTEYFVYDEELPFDLAIIDDIVQIVVTKGDEPRALIQTTSDDVYDWAMETFSRFKRKLTPLTVSP